MSDLKSRLERMREPLRVIESPFVKDWSTVRRAWSERLFTWPWEPWVSTKQVHSPVVYAAQSGEIICSPQTASILRKQMGDL